MKLRITSGAIRARSRDRRPFVRALRGDATLDVSASTATTTMALTEEQCAKAVELLASGAQSPVQIAQSLGVDLAALALAMREQQTAKSIDAILELNRIHRRFVLDQLRLSAIANLAQIATRDSFDRSADETRAMETSRKACVDLLRVESLMNGPSSRGRADAGRSSAAASRRSILDPRKPTQRERQLENDLRRFRDRVAAERRVAEWMGEQIREGLQRLGEQHEDAMPPATIDDAKRELAELDRAADEADARAMAEAERQGKPPPPSTRWKPRPYPIPP